MITPAEIMTKAERRYEAFLLGYLRGESFEPFTVPVGKIPTDLGALLREGTELKSHSKAERGYGCEITWKKRRTRLRGNQDIPVQIQVTSAADFLKLIGREREFWAFERAVMLIRTTLPALELWLQSHPLRVIEYDKDWPYLLEVCQYFALNPRPGLYVRELPVRVHTKWIETHEPILRSLLDCMLPPQAIDFSTTQFERRFGLRPKDEAQLRMRMLDSQLKLRYGLLVDEMTLPISQASALDFGDQHCIIVENKVNFLTLPRLPNSMALWGKGFQVTELDQLPWLEHCQITYWGDLDSHGFQILSALRSRFAHVRSIMMNRRTYDTFEAFKVRGTPSSVVYFSHLTDAETELAEFLTLNTLRLEQEHISNAYAVQEFLSISKLPHP